MPRWDIGDSARRRESEPPPKRDERHRESDKAHRSAGRGPSDDSSSSTPDRPERKEKVARSKPPERRIEHRDRQRGYKLRSSEIEAMSDIGRFRTVDIQDLSRFAYRGDEARMQQDLESLRKQGLVEEKTLLRAHKQPRKVVTLTEHGHRIVRKKSGLPKDQRIYHGFVKTREINHDADLYKVYQQAGEEIRAKGGRAVKVRLDFELKAIVQREKQASKDLSKAEQGDRLQTLAKEHGLTISSTRIHVPDIQMEYETREHELERANLELVSENYRSEGIRKQGRIGFHALRAWWGYGAGPSGASRYTHS